jgi:hypothetical protein
MNYKKIYDNLITSRRTINKTLQEYVEVHHIVPKCLGGSDLPDNLVPLTYREHYLAHWLLTKIYPNNNKVLWAFSLMDGKLSPYSKRTVTSRQFEQCRQALRKAARINWTNNNPMHRSDVKEKISNNMKGANNPLVKYPHKNRTAYPVQVTFTDGTTKEFECGKYAQEYIGVPSVTWKYWIAKGVGSKKYGVKKIKKLVKDNQNANRTK